MEDALQREFVKANLMAIVEQLESCEYACEGGPLEMNTAFIELKRIASEKHNVAACFAGIVDGMGIRKSVAWVSPEEIGKPPLQDGLAWKVTAELLPEVETAGSAAQVVEGQHVYHHSDSDGARVSVKVEKNTKGFNYEASISGAKSVDEAIKLLLDTERKLQLCYGAPLA